MKEHELESAGIVCMAWKMHQGDYIPSSVAIRV